METVNCIRCDFRHKDNGNCTAVGGFCTAVAAAHCPLLLEYLDTGLTPAEVNDAVVGAKLMAKAKVVSVFGVAAERLLELAEADKAGRVVVLPCKPGAPVYMTFCGEVWEMRVGQFHVNGYTEPRIWADIDCDWASTQCVRWDLEIGKRIFLTREEAEKALEAVK